MAVEIVMPKWGLSMEKGQIIQWLKEEGEAVEEGEELVEIESDKITNVVEAPAAGILARIVHPAGSEVAITRVIGVITDPGEPVPEIEPAAPTAEAVPEPAASKQVNGAPKTEQPAPTERIRAMPVARRLAEEHDIDLASVEGTGPRGAITKGDVEKAIAARAQPAAPQRIRAMPVARRLAAERGLDLATVTGTGPNGAITKGDVEKALEARQQVKPLRRVAFYSEGHRLEGLLYSPRNIDPDEKRAGVVLCVGYTYLKELVLPDIAKSLTQAGYVALVFDYRGFGESEGPRWRLIPHEQVHDVRAALTFLANQAHVNARKLAVVGLSLGGSHAITAAALDERIRAAVAIESPGNGRRWLRRLRRHYEWQQFEARLAADRTRRVLTGQSERVDPLDIMLPDPDSKAFLDGVYQEFPQMKCDLPLETADALIEYSPESIAARLAPRPLLLIHGAEDRIVPADESRQLYAQAAEPKRLVILPGLDHFNWVMPDQPGFQKVSSLIVEFLREHLPAA